MNKGSLDNSDCGVSNERHSLQMTQLHRDDVRFWQGVALSLAIFALGVLASLVLGLGFLWLSR